MTITVKKTIEQDEQIEIETPSFWKDENRNLYSLITEDNIIEVRNGMISIIGKGELRGSWYSEEAIKMIAAEKVTEFIFMERFFDVQDKINKAVGVSSLPTIFTQNKFGILQKEEIEL